MSFYSYQYWATLEKIRIQAQALPKHADIHSEPVSGNSMSAHWTGASPWVLKSAPHIVPPLLKILNCHPQGPDLQVTVTAATASGESGPEVSFLLEQVRFACDYAQLLHRRRFFRLTLHDRSDFQIGSDCAESYLTEIPRMAAGAGVRALQIIWPATDRDRQGFRFLTEELNRECEAHRLSFRPGFLVYPAKEDWQITLEECLAASVPAGRCSLRAEIPCEVADAPEMASVLNAIVQIVGRQKSKSPMDVELHLLARIPSRRDDVWRFIVRSVAAQQGAPITFQVLVEIDTAMPPGPGADSRQRSHSCSAGSGMFS